MQSGLGKLILKEEKEKQLFQERHARSLSAQRQTNDNAGVDSVSPLSTHYLYIWTVILHLENHKVTF